MNTGFEQEYYDFEEYWDPNYIDYVQKCRIEEVIKIIPHGISSVLDVGCGNGIFCNLIGEIRTDIKRIVGVDRSKVAIRHVKTNKLICDITRLPFHDNKFDLVVALEVLEHLPYTAFKDSLKKISEIAKDYIVISVPNNEKLNKNKDICPVCKTIFNRAMHKRSFNKNFLNQLFDEYGFRCKSIKRIKGYNNYIGLNYILSIIDLLKSINNQRAFNSVCPVCGYSERIDTRKNTIQGKNFQIIKKIAKWIWPSYKGKGWLLAIYKNNSNILLKMPKKSILFISALDFKEKSIQVIRKTPEAYVNAGWDVYYLVARDNSRYGNYFYEKIINPEGIKVYRFNMPLSSIRNKISNHLIRTITAKMDLYIATIKLAWVAKNILKKNSINILYGYEIHGILAIALLKFISDIKKVKIIHRFQGTLISDYLKRKNYLKLFLNWESIITLYLRSDLCIMTNDGTMGDKALASVRSKSLENIRFWINGVDDQRVDKLELKRFRENYNIIPGSKIAISSCRLESWKRIDRTIVIINKLIQDYKLLNIYYFIIGDGNERRSLENMVNELGIQKNVIFVGGVIHSQIKYYLNIADYFFSMNDISNVGNPLLEAIRAHKIIFTLNNGDTGSWIQHRKNGFIYDIDNNLIDNIAKDISELLKNDKLQKQIKLNISKTAKEKLWTWDERLRAEVNEVTKLLTNEN